MLPPALKSDFNRQRHESSPGYSAKSDQRDAITSISTSAPIGRALTANAERAG